MGGFFFALFLGDVILGWGQSQPGETTDEREEFLNTFMALLLIYVMNEK